MCSFLRFFGPHIPIPDKILKETSEVYASKLFKKYKKKGGYNQALKDFNKLVPTSAVTGKNRVRNNYDDNDDDDNNNSNCFIWHFFLVITL